MNFKMKKQLTILLLFLFNCTFSWSQKFMKTNTPCDIVYDGIADMDISNPIFTTREKGGRLLVTENPLYIKKDLPKYMPQLIVYSMRFEEDGPDPTKNPYYLYYQDFAIEKLKAMIDK